MARKTNKMITGPNGEQLPAHILHPQIVKGDALVREVVALAEKLSELSGHYNNLIFGKVQDFLEETAEAYGETWKGNTILKSYDGKLSVEIDVQLQKSYDERLQVASEKISNWIDRKLDMVKEPGARKVFEQVSQIAKTALRIDHKGNVDQKKLIQLKKFEFSGEPEWQEAMELIGASERVVGTKRYIRFKKADPETGKLEPIPVDFSKF